MAVCVISKNGNRLMPTERYGKVRHLLKEGKAIIVSYKPYFTIQLTYDTTEYTQDTEACMDTGYQHIGSSVKSENSEYLSAQYDLLTDEKQRHDDQRKYRRSRRNHLRNRAPRFNNRRKTKGADRKKHLSVSKQRQQRKNAKRRQKEERAKQVVKQNAKRTVIKNPKAPTTRSHVSNTTGEGWKAPEEAKWLSPSIKNKADRHVDLLVQQMLCFPVQDVYVELGEFDPMLMKALDQGKPILQGEDYQHGERYLTESLRSAVFARDNHTCVFCGRGIKEGAVLHAHHAYYWRNQHGNTMDELVTCCEKCHTAANHKEGGKLWGFDNKLKSYAPPAFMNSVRYYIIRTFKERLQQVNTKRQSVLDRIASGENLPEYSNVAPLRPVPMPKIYFTYGAATKSARFELKLEKSHVNDAYAMGRFHPTARAKVQHYQKRRRNNRILSKFYDAKYVDIRDNTEKTGSQLSCGRTNRKFPRNSDQNQRIYRGKKARKGYVSTRQKRYKIQPGTVVVWKGKKRVTTGSKNLGKQIGFKGDYDPVKKKIKQLAVTTSKVKVVQYPSGWSRVAIE